MLVRQEPVISASTTEDSALSITVVICIHNRPAVLERCLQRLRQVDEPAYSVVVVDSAPNLSEAESVAARYGALYEVSPLKGLSRARNIGTRVTHSDFIAYLDDDMVPHARWLVSLIAEVSNKDVMAATGPVLTLELADASSVELHLAVKSEPWGPNHFQMDRSSHQWFEHANFGGIGDGNFALRRSAFDQIRGFDERLGRGAPGHAGATANAELTSNLDHSMGPISLGLLHALTSAEGTERKMSGMATSRTTQWCLGGGH